MTKNIFLLLLGVMMIISPLFASNQPEEERRDNAGRHVVCTQCGSLQLSSSNTPFSEFKFKKPNPFHQTPQDIEINTLREKFFIQDDSEDDCDSFEEELSSYSSKESSKPIFVIGSRVAF